MRRIIILSITISLLSISNNDISAKRMNVVSYYNIHNKDGDKIFYKNGKWEIQDPGYGGYEAFVVDTRNGYIHTQYLGGDGKYFNTYTLYLDKKKNRYFGISSRSTGLGACNSSPEIKFLNFTGNKSIDVAGKLLPNKDIIKKLFFKKSFITKVSGSKLSDAFTSCYSLEHILPRYGTTIKVKLHYPDMQYYHHDNKNDLVEINKNILYKTVELKWDLGSGKFNIGNKIK